jgi:hypothetical protein
VADQQHPTTGASLTGVPVVDLTATVSGLLEHADEVREQRAALLAWANRYAASMARRADYLEDLATVLGGTR